MARLRRSERVALGLTLRNVAELTRQAIKQNPGFREMDDTDQAAILTSLWQDSAPLVDGEKIKPGEFDWDKIFEFLERIIALIMKLFGL